MNQTLFPYYTKYKIYKIYTKKNQNTITNNINKENMEE